MAEIIPRIRGQLVTPSVDRVARKVTVAATEKTVNVADRRAYQLQLVEAHQPHDRKMVFT